MEKRYFRKDNSVVWINLTASLSRDQAGEPDYFIAVIQDISERKHVEDQIRKAVRQRDEFLAMMSHELRNLLSAARMATCLLAVEETPAAVEAEARNVIDRQMSHMTRLLDDLLDVSRFTTGKLQMRKEAFNLTEVVQQASESVAAVARAGRNNLHITLPADSIWVFGDPHRLQQAIANLLANAIKYSPDETEVLLEVSTDDTNILIEVRDHGLGIEPELLDSIFEMFVQSESSIDRSRGGMGLGLTLVRSIIEAHDGEIRVASGVTGRGSLFPVTLPMTAPPQNVITVEKPSRKTTIEKIVIVEDQDDARTMLRSLLTIDNFEVVDYSSPVKALEQLEQDRPDAAILDIGLPGMSGYELAQAMRKVDASLYLIALTGYGQDEDVRRALDAGFDRHLVKPLRPEQLEEVLNSLPGD